MALKEWEKELSQIEDRKVSREVISSDTPWSGRVVSMVEDRVVVVPDGEAVVRQYTAHPGAVAIVALRGEAGKEEVLLERQYRHPVRSELWEIPAGLLDIPGEDPLVAAQRELAEEADLQAGRWDVLVDYFTSPGGSTEPIRIFLARELCETGEVFEREDEEATMVSAWVPLDEAVAFTVSGRVHNPNTVVGILAAQALRARQWEGLRDAHSPWFR